jgi:hypothetical protein
MTNREWLNKLSDEELAKMLNDEYSCSFCTHYVNGELTCSGSGENICLNGIKKWLREDYEKPMPEIKAGDYIVYEKDHCLCRAVCVYGNIVYRIDRGGCCNYGGEMQEKTISIKRYDITNGTLEDIWRADNEN